MSRIEIEFTDLTCETTDAVVNAANDELINGAGVCGAIHSAGGPEVEAECLAFPASFTDAETGEPVSEEEVERVIREEDAEAARLAEEADEDDSFAAGMTGARMEELVEEEGFDLDDFDFAAFMNQDFDMGPARRIFHAERCPVGDAKITTAGDMPAKYCIHAVGPIWHDGQANEVENLARVHRRIIEIAGENGCASVSLPAISTGIYGFPMQLAAEIAVEALQAALEDHPEVELVRFCVIDKKTHRAFASALGTPLPSEEIEVVIELDIDSDPPLDGPPLMAGHIHAFSETGWPVAQFIIDGGGQITGGNVKDGTLNAIIPEEMEEALEEMEGVLFVSPPFPTIDDDQTDPNANPPRHQAHHQGELTRGY